jgi:hypothetical protein
MSNNFFDDSASELDMLEEAQETADYVEEEYEEAPQAEYEDSETEYEPVENVRPSYDLNRKEKSVVGEAILRLEQARLYEMLLKHNFFEGVSNNISAKQNVEQELKKFILDRLEILLGIKQESHQVTSSEVTVELPFNNVEIDFLKALAYQGTKGASGDGPSAQAQATVQPTKLQQLPKMQPQTGLRPLSQPKQQSRPAPARQPQPAPSRQPQPAPRQQQRPAAPPQRQPMKVQKPSPKKGPRTVDEIAREDIARMKNRKPAHEMNAKELMAANKKIEGGGSRTRPRDALPMPSAEQQITNIIAGKSSHPKGGAGFNDILSRALGAVPLETVNDD